MTARTQTALRGQIASQLPDNTSRSIMPAHVRGNLTDVVDSLGGLLFNVRNYGATGDGATDDAAAIQAAINAALPSSGIVYFPTGSYRIYSTLTLGPGADDTAHGVSLMGAGPHRSKIQWVGPTDGTCLRVDKAVYYKVSGLHIANGGARGTTHGVWIRGSSGSGTVSYASIWEHVLIEGFATGWRAGEIVDWQLGRAASEYLVNGMTVIFCDTGILLEDLNTLDFVFIMLGISHCGRGLWNHTAGNVHVYGGSASWNTIEDFYLLGPGTSAIEGFRSETSKRFIHFSPGGYTGLTVKCCMVSALTNADGIAIQLRGRVAATILNSSIFGKVTLGAGAVTAASISLINSQIADTDPFRAEVSWDDLEDVSYAVLGCQQVDTSNNLIAAFPDEVGVGSGYGRAAAWRVTPEGQLQFPSLPTIDPAVAGTAWNDAGVLKISAG